jgi:hypothetical protein
MARKLIMPWARPFLSRKTAWLDGYQLGFVEGHRESAEWTRQRIVDELNHDAVLTMTLDTDDLERIVRIVEQA